MLDPLKGLINPALCYMVDEEMYQETAELFSEILSNYSKFLSEQDLQSISSLLTSQWSQERYTRLVQGDYDFASFQFGQLLLAFGDATVQDLARKSSDGPSQEFLSCLNGLLAAEGYAVAEDKIFVPALEFWLVRPILF